MNTDRLFDVLSAIHPISATFKQAIEKELTLLSFPKHYLLLEAPAVARHAYFLETGFAMCYRFVKDRKQVEGFWAPGQIIVSATSFFEQVPSREFIQLAESSDVFCLSYDSLQHLFRDFPEGNFIQRVVMNRYYEHSRERTRDLQHLNAVERYEKLLRTFPSIEQSVTQEHIASYLGIAPQSLSRIKRRKGRP